MNARIPCTGTTRITYLGNTELITDRNGAPYQYFWYSPWGEALVEQSSLQGGYSSPFRFNGKELDEETGNYYYGARYYDPRTSIWLSVDPLSSEAPHLTPYHFVSNNPIMRIDPDGLTDYTFDKETGKLTVVDGTQDDGPDKILRQRKFLGINLGTSEVQLEGKIENMHDGEGVDDEGEFTYQTYTFSESGDADKAYSFMANSTNVEIGKWEMEKGDGTRQDRFFTSGDKDKIRGEYLYMRVAKNDDSGLKLLSHTHNHGNPRAGRTGTYGPSPEDKDFAKGVSNDIFNGQSPAPKFFIWRYGTKTQYNKK